MKTRDFQRGQALILIVLGIVGLVMITGLAVDGGNTYADRQNAQTAADAAALSAALRIAKYEDEGDWADKAFNTAETNGYPDGVGGTEVAVNSPPLQSARCNGSAGPYDGEPEYVQVVIRTDVDTYLARVLGMKETHNCVEAIAHGKPGAPPGSGPFGGAPLVATSPNACYSMLLNGGAEVNTTGGGIFVNSSCSQALLLNGGANLNMDSNGMVVGGFLANGGASWTPGITTGATQLSMPLAEWNYIPAIPATPTCSGNASISGPGSYSSNSTPPNIVMNSGTATLSPGNIGNLQVLGGTLTFSPGTYCISGNFNIAGGGTVLGLDGRVELVTSQGPTFDDGVTLDFNDVEIYTNNASWTINSNSNFIADRLRFYSSGSAGLIVNGNSSVTSINSYIYLQSGTITWNGNATLDLSAPPVGDPYAGLLLYMPWSNTSSVIFNGGSGINLTGTFLAPHAAITINGGTNVNALHSQIIGYTYIINGGGAFNIEYQASENYGSPLTTAAIVELVK